MTDETLRKMLSEMSHVWKTESAFMSWLRGGIRRMWSKHPVRIEFMKQNRIRIPNPNKNGKADRKSTRLNSSHNALYRMPSSA